MQRYMLSKRNLSYINNLRDLNQAKKEAVQEIHFAEQRLEYLLSDLPLQALGNAVGFVAGAVAKGFKGAASPESEKTYETGETAEAPSIKETLKSVGEETAYFALAKLVEKLLTQR